MTTIRVIFTMDATPLTESQRDALRARFEWTIVNRRAGRVLVDALGKRSDFIWLRDRLIAANLHPKMICRFNGETGKRVFGDNIDVAEFVKVARGRIETENGPEVFPTAWVSQHEYLGLPSLLDEEESQE